MRYDAIGNALPHLPWGRSAAVIGHIHAINPYAFYEQMKAFKNHYPYIREYQIDDMEDKWNKFIVAIRDQKEKEVRQDMIIQYGSLRK